MTCSGCNMNSIALVNQPQKNAKEDQMTTMREDHSINKTIAYLTMHLFADIRDIREDRFLVSFSEKLGWSNGVPLFRCI